MGNSEENHPKDWKDLETAILEVGSQLQWQMWQKEEFNAIVQ